MLLITHLDESVGCAPQRTLAPTSRDAVTRAAVPVVALARPGRDVDWPFIAAVKLRWC